MKQSSNKQSNVLIRAKSPEEKKLLEDLRKVTDENTYTRAVMIAIRFYLNEREEMKKEIEELEKVAELKHMQHHELISAFMAKTEADRELSKVVSKWMME